VHLRPEERLAVERIASRSNLWLEAPVNMLLERIAKREMDASDATTDRVSAQAKQPTGAVDWRRVDASTPVEIIVRSILATIFALIVPAGPPAASPSRIYSYPASLDLLAVP
jgi:predicted kinase